MATFYLDFENGDDSKDGSTFANRWKTITNGATAARLTPGDVIRVMKSPDPVSLGVNGTFTKLSPTITLASSVTQNISTCETAWTASTNVTTTTSATRKEGTLSTSIAPAAAFTTGVMAYLATGTLNLSTYQKVTFWIQSNVAIAANSLRLDLCSDTAGATPVNSFTINVALETSWTPFTFDNGSALGSSIQSVALTALTDFGAATILLDNIFATNNISLTSVIGTSSSATGREWYSIRSVNGTTVIMDTVVNNSVGNTSRGYCDTTTTTTAYTREFIRITTNQTTKEAGTATARYLFSGGWDRTSMSTQNGMTFLSGWTVNTVLLTANFAFTDFEYFGLGNGNYSFSSNANSVRLFNSFILSGTNFCASFGTNAYAENCVFRSEIAPVAISGGTVMNNCSFSYCSDMFYQNGSRGIRQILNNCVFSNHVIAFSGFSAPGLWAKNLTIKDCGTAFSSYNIDFIDGLSTSGNTTVFNNCSGRINNYTTSGDTTIIASNTTRQSQLFFSRYAGYVGAQYNGSTLVVYDVTTPLHGTTSRSWRHDVQAENYTVQPVIQPLQPFAVGTSTLVTFKIWVYRTSTNVEGRIRLLGYVTPGVDADVTATITAPINTWQELTVTCTPTAAGVVRIYLESYTLNGNTGTVYFGDATVTQA